MVTLFKKNSLSAPIISTKSPVGLKKFVMQVSEESSPSNYIVRNQRIDFQKKIGFFESSLRISEMLMLDEDQILDPINQDNKVLLNRSKSVNKNLNYWREKFEDNSDQSFRLGRALENKTIFECDEEIYRLQCKDREFSDYSEETKLDKAELSRFKKRKERCELKDEKIDYEVMIGEIKRYSLKGRFGFIYYKNGKIPFYEDELVLSGVNLKKFKQKIKQKVRILVKFSLKKGHEGDQEKIKPVNIILA